MTNFEKIKQMSVKELSEFLDDLTCACFSNGMDEDGVSCEEQCPFTSKYCHNIVDWLESEVENESD